MLVRQCPLLNLRFVVAQDRCLSTFVTVNNANTISQRDISAFNAWRTDIISMVPPLFQKLIKIISITKLQNGKTFTISFFKSRMKLNSMTKYMVKLLDIWRAKRVNCQLICFPKCSTIQ